MCNSGSPLGGEKWGVHASCPHSKEMKIILCSLSKSVAPGINRHHKKLGVGEWHLRMLQHSHTGCLKGMAKEAWGGYVCFQAPSPLHWAGLGRWMGRRTEENKLTKWWVYKGRRTVDGGEPRMPGGKEQCMQWGERRERRKSRQKRETPDRCKGNQVGGTSGRARGKCVCVEGHFRSLLQLVKGFIENQRKTF